MPPSLDEYTDLLRRTPELLRALLAGLPDTWTDTPDVPAGWRPHDVVGHLIHGEETDWIPRAQIILQQGESRPFEPFDRFAQFDRPADQPIEQLLDTFSLLRRNNLGTLRQMRPTADLLERRGTHPELGTVTLRQLLATWVVHDLNHLGQIAEVMARQYTQAVGPWQAYLPILTR